MRPRRAYCPCCGSQGTLGRACHRPGCRVRGMAFIPSADYRAYKELPEALQDGRVGTFLGDTLLVERLSRGAFGQLYRGLRLPLLMRTAVKVLDPVSGGSGLAAETLAEMFTREAQALASLSHPNVVRLLDFAPESEPPYLLLEYIVGARTLGDVLARQRRRGGRMGPRRAEALLAQVLWGLAEAHERGVVHLDLRPANIGLQHAPGYQDFVRLLDFGLAVLNTDTLAGGESGETEARGFGTPMYIAPERIDGGEATPAADLYAVGVMAFELLLGYSPFGERSSDEIVAVKRDSAFDPTEALATRGYPEAVLDFFGRTLARAPGDRFESAADCVTALTRAVDALVGPPA